MEKLTTYLKARPYPGRGIVLGRGEECAVALYFIMGRSQNSRNRVFEQTGDGIQTRAHDPKLVTDPSLIIYHPVRLYRNNLIVTNGDQTDTVLAYLQQDKGFEEALGTRTFEPDAPHYTPRISGLLDLNAPRYHFSILRRRADGACAHNVSYFEDMPRGTGHILHTYAADSDPLPSFAGGPVEVELPAGDIDACINEVFESLHAENRVALYMSIWPFYAAQPQVRVRNRHV